MPQAGTLQFGVDESFLSQSVSRALINGTKLAQRNNAFTPGINEQAFRQPLGRITGDVNKFQSSLAAANQRVIAFGASASVFYGISTALRGLVTSTIQVNKSMVEINSIFGLSQKSLASFKNELFDVARKTSQSFGTVAESAKEFSRQGLSVAETLKRVRDSMILTRMTGLSAADAANTLTAALNSFNKSGLDSTEILNKMVAADTNFAVSSKDLADALTRVGSSAQDAGVQFEELLALVTSVKQITGREGSVIANGFKSIFNREQRSTTIEQLEKLGVAVRDQNSNMLPTIQVLKNLAKQYDTLGISQKQQVAQMMGGVYQMNTLKALMSDLSKENSIYNQALREIGKSQDEAIKRNEYLNTSFASMIERAQATFGQIGANLGEKIFTSNTGSIKQAINSLFGRENFEGFIKGLEGVDTEGIGNKLGSGLIKGLGNTFGVTNGVPGPGLLAIGLGITRVLTTSVGMAVKDMASLVNFGQKSQNINVGIERAILGANEAEKMRLASAKSVAAQEAVILDILIRQNAAMAAMKAERSALQVSVVSNNPTLAKEAIKMSKWVPPTAASGLLPAIAQESHLISKGIGGATPSAKPVVIPNFNFGGGQRGPVVANTDEYLVPNYKGAGSAIFNRQMVASQGLPSGAVRVAASGLTPINIENQFGRLFGELSRGGQFNINGITTSQKGMGYSNKLYAELVGLLGERGARSIFGKLVPQEAFNNSNIKAVLPQLTRGKHGRSNLLRMFGEDDQFGPAINFRGGSDFDTDLGNNAGRILRMMQQGYGATEFTTFLAGGHIPNFANKFYRGITPSINKFNGKPLSPFDFSYTKGSLFASRDFGEAMSYADQQHKFVGEFSLKKGLKGLNLFSKSGRDKLAEIIEKHLDQDDFFTSRMSPDKSKYEEVDVPVSHILRNMKRDPNYNKSYFNKDDVRDIFRTLDRRSINNLLRSLNYDFITFPDLSGEGRQVNRNISILTESAIENKKWKNAYTQEQISKLSDPYTIASGYIPNFARRGRPSIKGRQIRYEGDMDFSSVLGPEGLMQLFTIFGFGLGNYPTKSTIDRRALEKFGISIPEGLTPGSKFPYRGAAGGLVPKSLSNAISREIKAGAPLSSIYLDKDSRLISKDNPMGLLVANRRDEPSGGFEGVNRYQNIGLNPKLAGSHIPNFATQDPSEMILKYLTKGNEPRSILGNITYPGSSVSTAEAQKSIEKYLSGLIKKIDLKSIDFTSSNFTTQIQKKVKDSIQKSFQGVDFGRTSAFSKITDQIIQDREREIKSLIKYQGTIKLNAALAEKQQKYLSEHGVDIKTIGSKIIGGPTQGLPSNELIRNAADFQTTQNIEWPGSKLATQINKQTSIQSETLAAIKRQAAANTIQSKLSTGKMFGDLTGLEQITLRKQFQQQAYQQLGFASSGASLMSVMRNKEARGQISDYVNQQIALISRKEQIPQLSSWQKWKARAGSPMGQMVMMMAPSMLSGFIPEGEGGTKTGMALGAAQTGLVGMGTGAMFGPIGALVGAGIGGFMGIASKWNKSFDEIGREIEEVHEKNQKVINNIQLYMQQADQVTELIGEGTSPKRIKELINKQSQLLGSIDDANIRSAIIGRNPEEALRLANQKAIEQQQKGNITSSIARNEESVGTFARLFGRISPILSGLSNAGLAGGVSSLQVAKYGQSVGGVGGLTAKQADEIATSIIDASDKLTGKEFRDFSDLAKKGSNYGAFTQYYKQLGFSDETFAMAKERLSISEINNIIDRVLAKKTRIETTVEENRPFLQENERRFQLSQLKWGRAGLASQLQSQTFGIRGRSRLTNQTAISSALLDLNPNITDIQRVAQGGDIQLNNLRQVNSINLRSAALQAQAGLGGLSTQNVKPEQLKQLSNLFFGVAKTGDASNIQKYINELIQKQEDTVNSLIKQEDDSKDQTSNLNALVSYTKDQLTKFNELIETAKAQEEELRIANSINVIRAKEQERQKFLSNANYDTNTFVQARRLRESAEGKSVTRTRYSGGLTLQSAINEQDFYSNLGIAQTDESLGYYNRLKTARAQSTLATLLEGETGKKVSPYDLEGMQKAISSVQNPIMRGRYQETYGLIGYDANAEIRKLGSGQSSTQEIVDKVLRSQNADPMQSITAQNTGRIADISQSTHDEVVDGFDSIWSLMDSAIRGSEWSNKYTEEYRSKVGFQQDKSNLEINRERLIQSGLEGARGQLGKVNFNSVIGYQSAMKDFASGGSYEDLRKNLLSYENYNKAKQGGMVGSYDAYERQINTMLEGLAKRFGSEEIKQSLIDNENKILEASNNILKASESLSRLTNEKLIATPNLVEQTNISGKIETPGAIKSVSQAVTSNPIQKQAKEVNALTESWQAFTAQMKVVNSETKSFGTLAADSATIMSTSFGDAFGQFVTGSMNSTAAFRNFAASVISDIAKMYAQKAMMGMISGTIGLIESMGGGFRATNTFQGSGAPASTATYASAEGLGFAMGGKVPALLTGGEYYFTPSAAKAIGQNNLNAINHGTARFAGGGLVRGGSGYMDDVPAMLDNGGFVVKRSAVQKYGANNLAAMARNLGGEVRMYASGGNVSPAMGVGGSSSGSGGNTNVKIELHDNRTSASASSDNSVNDPEFNKRLSIAIKSTVLQTVNEQRRIGGSLRQSQNY